MERNENMSEIRVDFNTAVGKIKPMHAVNNGPLKKRSDQTRDNYDEFAAAKIPYMRPHDASFCAAYGGEHSIDVHLIFRDFDADPFSPESYDFTLTDEYLERTLSAGTKIFYRLGSKIEHEIKKYGTLPPKDFKKWAIICEHMIRHFNFGWADGHEYDIEYFEIWNEPDLFEKCWNGTEIQFFELFETAAKHLKACFPELKIGGPALAYDLGWGEHFLSYMQAHKVPLDFFSWHIYSSEIEPVAQKCRAVRDLLDKYGYTDAESILNEYNLVYDWSPRFIESIEAIISEKGAAFTASCMLACQSLPLDMLMYYDARPCPFNGMWDFYTMRALKGYYPFVMFSKLYELGTAVKLESDLPKVRAAAAKGVNGDRAVMLSYFSNEMNSEQSFALDIGTGAAKIYTLDRECTMEKRELKLDGALELTMKANTVLLIELPAEEK